METKLCDMTDSGLTELQIEMQKYLEQIEEEIIRRKCKEERDDWNKVIEAIDDYFYKHAEIWIELEDDDGFYINRDNLALDEIGKFIIHA